MKRLPWGYHPSARLRPAASFDEVPSPSSSVLGVSHALDGLHRPRSCGFISPRCHVQGSSLQGFVPLCTAAPARRWPLPSRRFATSLLQTASRLRQSLGVRPQGFSPCRESVACKEVLPASPARSPLGFRLLQVFALCTVENAFTLSSARGLGEDSVSPPH